MNDNATAMTGTVRAVLSGLPQRLVLDGLIEEAAMLDAIASARERKTHLVSWLVSHDLAAARDIAIAAAQEFGVPLLDLDAVNIDIDTVRLVNDKLMAKHRVLPLVKRGKRLHVAVSDPTNLHAVDEIKFQTGLAIEAVIVEDDKLQRAVQKAIEQVDTSMPSLGGEEDFDLENLDVSAAEDQIDADTGRDDIEDAPIVRFVNKIMLDAIRKNASDIHFEPYEKYYRIRLRVDGVLREVAQPPVQLATKLAARLKVMSRLDIAERRVPQDGRIKMRLSKNRSIDFRVSSCPTLFGEKIVLRILDASTAMMGIDALGYEPFQKDLYMKTLARPQGMILVTGPTGSGKTVSLYTGLSILNVEDTNISTAEDPAEIVLPGVNQVNVNPKVGLTFASALRAFLRQDPDVIMVGEVRDLETAEIAIKAAQTGHLVLSTLHTNDAPTAVTRLLDLGIPAYLINSTLLGVMAQRLVRTLCPHCKEPAEPPDDETWAAITAPWRGEKPARAMAARGCLECRMTGYLGRIGLYEIMLMTPALRRLLHQDADDRAIREQAFRDGMKPLRVSGAMKVAAGITTADEVVKVAPLA